MNAISVNHVEPIDCTAILPGWWRLVLMGLSALILTACRGPEPHSRPTGPPPGLVGGPGFAPPMNYIVPRNGPPMPIGCNACASDQCPCPGGVNCFHADEYLCDGGDQGLKVTLDTEFTIRGLDQEDTIAHADTKDGRILIQPSNKVCLYAPRFASVRKIDPAGLSEQVESGIGAQAPLRVALSEDLGIPTTALQQQPLTIDIASRRPIVLRERELHGTVANELSPRAFQDRFKAHENLLVIKTGILDQAEKAYLSKLTLAAITWTKDQGAQVSINRKKAMVFDGDRRADATYTVKEPECPKLRVLKCASTDGALPGDLVDFTIRYDNVGDATIGNVTIVDNLTTRLEYVPDSAQSSLKATFSTQVNEGDSLVLRWEITDPLKPGQGGILRFQTRVR